ncbi:MAG: dTDP-4-amino-4,6-dideoxygalactose transaminase [Dehalococcoidia bacterium]|jgi:dTDP-4-amino-4,6-dideoxygalactose transaminase
MKNIPFNKPTLSGGELANIKQALKQGRLSGDGPFTQQCQAWLEKKTGCGKALLTPSCTHALEMCALLADIKAGDEVIMSSFTHPSTANAFALRGAQMVFVDIRPDTMNIDEKLIEDALTPRTRAIVPMHYAGVACEMDAIMKIAASHNLIVVEDAAPSIMCTYKDRPLGTIGHLGCYSFHETKDLTCGEGGALLVNDDRFIERAQVIRQKGTDYNRFLNGMVSRYTWQEPGSSYLPSELNAAFLLAQLEKAEDIINDRLKSWQSYFSQLSPLAGRGSIELPCVPQDCRHNGNTFYIMVQDEPRRAGLIDYLRVRGIASPFHYIPLHSSSGGLKYGRFHGEDKFTTRRSGRLLRLPIYHGIKRKDLDRVISALFAFFPG